MSLSDTSIDEAVRIVDAPRPAAAPRPVKRFRLADAAERIAHGREDQPIEPHEHLPIGFLPDKVVVPGVIGEDEAPSHVRPCVPSAALVFSGGAV